MPDAEKLPYLIRLLDDDDPVVSGVVREELANYGGDVSQDLVALGVDLPTNGKKRLSSLLSAGRRATLQNEWQVPSAGVAAWEDDWERFEHALRLLSDILHDGITLRPALPDALDLLADELLEDVPDPDPDTMRKWLFAKGRFRGARSNADAPEFFDLCHVIDTQRGNPTSLACLFMLLGHRVGVSISACNYPGHFLALLLRHGRPTLVDCFHLGRTFDAQDLLEAHPEISDKARNAVLEPANLGVTLLRLLAEMRISLLGAGREDDAALLARLIKTLKP